MTDATIQRRLVALQAYLLEHMGASSVDAAYHRIGIPAPRRKAGQIVGEDPRAPGDRWEQHGAERDAAKQDYGRLARDYGELSQTMKEMIREHARKLDLANRWAHDVNRENRALKVECAALLRVAWYADQYRVTGSLPPELDAALEDHTVRALLDGERKGGPSS